MRLQIGKLVIYYTPIIFTLCTYVRIFYKPIFQLVKVRLQEIFFMPIILTSLVTAQL